MKLSHSISRLRKAAKLRARVQNIALHQAFDAIAREQGFASWSLLAAQNPAPTAAEHFLAHLAPGDLALIAAQREHGKTLFAFQSAIAAARAGLWTKIYSLELTEPALAAQLQHLDAAQEISLCCTNEISADLIASDLHTAGRPSFLIVDFLQALEHDRTKPALAEQLKTLKTAALQHQAIVCLISQIDRSFDADSKSFPSLTDLRLPNPIDTNLFTTAAFLSNGSVIVQSLQP